MEYDWQKKYYGIIIVDFANQELAHKIYSINEKVKAFYLALTQTVDKVTIDSLFKI